MKIIEIPTTVLLEEMLKKLQLPIPMYSTVRAAEGKMVALVAFYPAVHRWPLPYGSSVSVVS